MSPNLPDLASKCGLLGNPPVLGTVGRTCGHPTCGFPSRAGTESTLMSFPRVPATARIWPSAAALQLRANTSPQHAPETQGALAASTPTCARFPAWCSPTRPRLPNHVGPQRTARSALRAEEASKEGSDHRHPEMEEITHLRQSLLSPLEGQRAGPLPRPSASAAKSLLVGLTPAGLPEGQGRGWRPRDCTRRGFSRPRPCTNNLTCLLPFNTGDDLTRLPLSFPARG